MPSTSKYTAIKTTDVGKATPWKGKVPIQETIRRYPKKK